MQDGLHFTAIRSSNREKLHQGQFSMPMPAAGVKTSSTGAEAVAGAAGAVAVNQNASKP